MRTIETPNLEDLQAFLEVHRERSFSKAGRNLHTSSSVISKRIGRLESALKSKLFSRSTRVVTPTETADQIEPIARRVFSGLGDLTQVFDRQDKVEGKIRLTAPAPIARRVLAPLFAEFLAKYPGVTLDLILTDSVLNFAEHGLDLAIRISRSGETTLITKRLVSNRVVFCASPQYLKRNGEPRNLDDLKKHPLLFLDHHRNRRFLKTSQSLGDFSDFRVIHCNEGSMLTELILGGAGVGVRSWWDVQDLVKAGKLKILLKNHPLESGDDVNLIFLKTAYFPKRMRVFVDFLTMRLRAMEGDVG